MKNYSSSLRLCAWCVTNSSSVKSYNHRIDVLDNAIAAGFQMHIPKPVEPNTLAAAVVQLAKNNS